MRLKVRVRAVAEKNKANRALEALIAKQLKRAKSTVRVIAGGASRTKTVRVEGDPEPLRAQIEALAGKP